MPGDDPSLERILRDHSAFARRLAASHEANPEVARDLAQDILVAIWRAWPAFRHQCAERTYVARIAHHRIATHISRAVRQPPFTDLADEFPAGGPSPEEIAIQRDDAHRLIALVRTLPLAYREVAVLMLEGFTPAEVAETLGITANAVAIRGTRAREMLRALFGAKP
ncbi:MAG TPA: sigma-70 family RNA polymerase sigma factor [Steroidobacteraceae bacterium]|jgi:RNA polymerase sigma-70 factor (ECF subfamily)|nr:sigma-70 family RNA polymerase sigma factor [Steroidobacteraceae bacterium]